MELHSYAKLRGYKKWTIEQKRKLVEARINYDGIFSRKSSNCIDSWKKIMAAAKLNDFNVCFVRKQWANLIARYKAYKRTRLRQLGKTGEEISDQIVRQISEEWEFFYPIHSFMSRKTTNFHSYAQKPRAINGSSEYSQSDDDDKYEPPVPVSAPSLAPTSATTTKEESVQPIKIAIPPNTDHDFYSKSASREILDLDLKMEDESSAPVVSAFVSTTITIPENNCTANSIKSPKTEEVAQEKKVQTLGVSAKNNNNNKKKRKPSERDKYYKHKRRYDRRNERRLDALLNVFGQVLKEHFPNVDTSKLAAQSDQVSTEDEGSTMSISSVDSESTCTVPSTVSDESGL